MASSRLKPTRQRVPTGQQARKSASAAEQARLDFDRIAAEIAAHRPFDPATDPLPDLERLEAATALTTPKT